MRFKKKYLLVKLKTYVKKVLFVYRSQALEGLGMPNFWLPSILVAGLYVCHDMQNYMQRIASFSPV